MTEGIQEAAAAPEQKPGDAKQAQIFKEARILESKALRVDIDAVIQTLRKGELNRRSRERSLAMTKLQEAVMWLGMDLKELGGPNPYPNSYDVKNAIVDKTADGLKL